MSASPGVRLPPIVFPVLSDIPFVGPLLFSQDLIFYLSIALAVGVSWFLFRSRAGPEAARHRRQPRLGACARHQRHPHPLSGCHVRRRLCRPCRRAAVAGLYAAMGGEHVGGARLDRACARRLRILAALAGPGRRLSLRCGDRSGSCMRRRSGSPSRRNFSRCCPMRRLLSSSLSSHTIAARR